jgi:hypothetical protein
MEINTNLKAGGVGSPTPPARAAAAAAVVGDTSTFTSTAAIEKALASLPDVRAEAVERARTLTSQVSYPPLETIRKISKLLAIKIPSDGE